MVELTRISRYLLCMSGDVRLPCPIIRLWNANQSPVVGGPGLGLHCGSSCQRLEAVVKNEQGDQWNEHAR